MPARDLLLITVGIFLSVATVHAGDAHLVTADDIIETLGKPVPLDETLADTPGDGQTPRFRLRGISAQPRAPEIAIHILFKSGSVEVADDFSKKQMTEAGKALSSDSLKPYRFEIAGHTDSVGTNEYNQALSEQRAQALKHYLMNRHNVAAERLETIGYGESQPVATNDSADGRARNRRVVFKRIE